MARIICIMLICVLGSTVNAFAKLILEMPEKAARESAFVATAISDKPADTITFSWYDTTYKVKAREEDNLWKAKIMLPVNENDKFNSRILKASSNTDQAQKNIQIFSVKRPVQKLTVDKKYVEPPREVQERIKADREKVRNALAQKLPERMWEAPLLRPVPGGVTSYFGLTRVFNGQPRGKHRGLDLRAPLGHPIKACADGVVALVDDLYYSGNTVYINHGDGVFSAYLHMSDTKVKPGDKVARGQVIGLAGATGRVTGPHLHLSLYAQGKSVDPLPLLEQAQLSGKKQ